LRWLSSVFVFGRRIKRLIKIKGIEGNDDHGKQVGKAWIFVFTVPVYPM
jgi:hypothetical protein